MTCRCWRHVLVLFVTAGVGNALVVKEAFAGTPTIDTDLWDGMDVVEMDASQISMASSSSWGPGFMMPGQQSICMLGPQNTGTNLLVKTLHANWPDRVGTNPGGLDNWAWKHSLGSAADIQQLVRSNSGRDLKDLTLIIVTRTPLSHLTSMRKAPYYPFTPCYASNPMSMLHPCNTNAHQGRLVPNRFKDSMDIYNQYAQMALDLKEQNAFRHVEIVAYEDMVLKPEEVFAHLARVLEFPMPAGGIRILQAPAKPHGDPAGRAKALEKIRTRSYMSWMDLGLKRSLCSALDKAAVQKLNANYVSDCDTA